MKNEYTIEDFCKMIDHTNVNALVENKEIEKLCKEAKKYNFKMVAINQAQTKLAHKLLAGTDIHVGASISFPFGQTSIESKVFETKDAIKNGADEIDFVINFTEVKAKNWDYVEKEMKAIVDLCRKENIISKVIFENAYLTKDEIIKLCRIAKKVEPDFVKTSTGMAPSGAKIEDVKLMKENVGDFVKVKAAGGIRDSETFIEMIKNGAERIGCSAGIDIIEELKKKFAQDNIDYMEIKK